MSEATGRDTAVFRLNEADWTIDYQCKRLRALAQSILALLPADPFEDPLLSNAGRASEDAVASEQRTKLRDGLIAARDVADMIDDIACVMKDSTTSAMEQARTALGLPPPSSVRALRPKEPDHV
jgi:hypothetical protein